MLIVQLYSGQNTSSGDFYYRIEQPARWLAKVGAEVLNIDLLNVGDPAPLLKVPVLILHHLSDPDLLPVVTRRRELGLPTIYELADNFQASHEHLADAKRCGPSDYHVVIEELLKRCDAVQTTGHSLQEKFGHLNEKFMVFPNLIEKMAKNGGSGKSASRFTIGWGGSVRHFEDIKVYANTIIDWVVRRPRACLAIMGSRKVRRLFQRLPSRQSFYLKPGSLQDYLAFLDQLDVGVAPLLPTAFNQCRSDVKFLEYASHGVVPLCSRLGPYLDVGKEGESILLFKTCDELVSCLDHLFMQGGERNKIACAARHWVERNRLAASHDWAERLRRYRRLASHPLEAGQGNLPEIRHLADAKIGETLAAAIDSPTDQTLLLKNLEQVSPEHYQVHYFRGWASSKDGDYGAAIVALRTGLAKNPESIRTGQLLVRSLILAGKIDEAGTTLNGILAVEPDLATLVTLKGVILQLKNQHLEAFNVLESCIRRSPRLVEARLACIRSALKLRFFDCAEQQLCVLEALIPESPDVWFLRASLAQRRNATATKREYLQEFLK